MGGYRPYDKKPAPKKPVAPKKKNRAGVRGIMAKNLKKNPDAFSLLALPGVLGPINKQRIKAGKKLNAGGRAGRAKKLNAGVRKNGVEAARAKYEEFHGRPSEETFEITTAIHEHHVLSGIGEMVKLVVLVPSNNGHGFAARVKLTDFGEGCLLAQNEEGTQLYIEGGNQSVDLDVFGIHEFHELEVLGKVERVYYFTVKDHLGDDGGEAIYNHKFGGLRWVNGKRRRSPLPTLVYDVRNQLLMFAGGGYTIPAEGIDS